MNNRDGFHVDGGCWCPPEWTLYKLRIEGHSEKCTTARRGWKANMAHSSAIDRQRRIDAEAGRQLREAASIALGEQP